jgi:hypothetical protein
MEIAPVRDEVTGLKLETVKSKAGINLDVACGPNKQPGPGWIGIDIRSLPGVDIVHDLFQFPWPIESDSANLIAIAHYLEHIPGNLFFPTLAEVHRIGRHGATVLVAGPYGLGYRWQQDPTHMTCIVETTFAYLDPTIPREIPADHEHKGRFWSIYRPPVMHLKAFERVPAGGDADFNAALIICKNSDDCEYCSKGRRI